MTTKNKAIADDESPQVEHDQPFRGSITRIRADMTCPRCGKAKLDYNGLLQLVCPNCGLIETGAST